MLTESNKKNQKFRTQIRKKQITQVFQLQRRKFIQQSRKQKIYNLTKSFQNQKIKEQFIIQKSKVLQGQPSLQWQFMLTELKNSVYTYRSQLNKWIDLGIIKNLTLLFKQDNIILTNLAAEIITDIWYLSQKQQNERLIKRIILYDFVDELINLCKKNPKLSYIRLITCLADSPQRRKKILSGGILQIVQNLLQNVKVLETQLNYYALSLAKVILTVFRFDKDTSFFPQKQVIKTILPHLNKHISFDYSNKYYLIILLSIKELVKMKNEWVYQQILKSENIIKKLFQLQTFSQDNNIRLQATYIFSLFMYSQNSSHIDQLLQLGLLDNITELCLKEQNENNLILLLNVIGNLTADQDFYRQIVANHRILDQVILKDAQYHYSKKVKQSAMFCLCNLIRCKNPQLLGILVYKYNALEIIKKQLKEAIKNIYYFDDLVGTVEVLMQNAYKYRTNEIGKIIQEKYQIQEFLINLQEQIPQVVKIFISTLQEYQ